MTNASSNTIIERAGINIMCRWIPVGFIAQSKEAWIDFLDGSGKASLSLTIQLWFGRLISDALCSRIRVVFPRSEISYAIFASQHCISLLRAFGQLSWSGKTLEELDRQFLSRTAVGRQKSIVLVINC